MYALSREVWSSLTRTIAWKHLSNIVSYYQDPKTKERFLQNLLPDALIIDEGNIQQLYAAKNGKRLHKLVIDSCPLSLGSWKEYGEVSSQVADL